MYTNRMINTEALQRSYTTVREKWDPHFDWVVNDSVMWTPFKSPLAQTNLALVTTCGAYRKDVDLPFDASNYYGDPSFREIPSDTEMSAIDFAHTHFNHEHVAQDGNVAFPLDRLRELARDGVIASVANPTISFSGYLPQTKQLVNETAPAAAKRLKEVNAHAALLVPC